MILLLRTTTKQNGGRKIARKESGNIEQPLRFKMKIVIIKN